MPHYAYGTFALLLLQIESVQDALDLGFCGECPSKSPSSPPTKVPTALPTLAPTGALDDCDLDPPSCELDPSDDADRVTFCFVFGSVQVEICAKVDNIQTLLGLGKAKVFTVVLLLTFCM